MRHLTHFICAFALMVCFIGCGGPTKTAKRDTPSTNDQQRQPPAQAPDDQSSADSKQEAGGSDKQETGEGGADGSKAEQPPAQPARRRPRGMRPGDNLRVGGGGFQPTGDTNNQATADANRQRQSGQRGGRRLGDNLRAGGGGNSRDARGNNNSTSEPAFSGGGLANGFFPQPIGDSFDAGDALVNGFFPQSTEGGKAEFVSVPAPIIPSVKLREKATEAFQQRNEKEAFNHLYAYMLVSDTARSEYPVKWYSGLREPRAAFRWGVGVNYTPPKGEEEMAPMVIGDPDGSRERESARPQRGGRSRGGRSRGARGRSRGGDSLEGPDGPNRRGGSAPSGGGSTNSPYANVSTEHPEGFLLYFTGDYGDGLLDRLETRRKSPEANFGAVLRDLIVDYSDEKIAAGAPAPRRPANSNRGGQRNGDRLTVGGGSRPPANRGGGGAGANNAAAGSNRADRVSTGGPSVKPEDNTTGTLIPGVMLVGNGSKDELVERATNMGLDGLFLFTVRVKSGRNAIGSCNVKVLNLRADDVKEQIVFNGRTLHSDKVAEDREKEGRADPVELALDDLFESAVDLEFKADSLPGALKTKASVVENRIKRIAETSQDDPLPAAYEIVSYHQQGLVADTPARSALNTLFGAQVGEILLTGDEKAKVRIINRYLAK